MIKFRLAKLRDYKSLSKLHREAGKFQEQGFMFKLGIFFLRNYYKTLLKGKNSVVVLAEDNNNQVYGFVSGTTAADEHLANLNRQKLKFAFLLIGDLLFNPLLIKEVIKRYNFISKKKGSDKFGVTKGARIEYWLWDVKSKSLLSVFLLKSWLNIVKELGGNEIDCEVDSNNLKSQRGHEQLGAKVYKKEILSDGRKRLFYRYTV